MFYYYPCYCFYPPPCFYTNNSRPNMTNNTELLLGSSPQGLTNFVGKYVVLLVKKLGTVLTIIDNVGEYDVEAWTLINQQWSKSKIKFEDINSYYCINQSC